MTASDLLAKVKTGLATLLSKEENIQLEEIIKAAAPPAAAVTLKEVKTKDGLKALSYDGELAEGVALNDMSTGVPLPAEGDFELEDGTKITAVAGKVTKVTKAEATPPAAPEMAAMATQMSALSVQLAEEKASTAAINAQLAEVKKANAFLATQLQKILNTPVYSATPEKKATQLSKEEYDKLTNHQKAKYNRGESY